MELHGNYTLGSDPCGTASNRYLCHLDLLLEEVRCRHVSRTLRVELGPAQVLIGPLTRGGLEVPRLHVFPAPALCSGRDSVLSCGLWRMAKPPGVAQRVPLVWGPRTLNVGRMHASPH
jgi:hypothetical protein